MDFSELKKQFESLPTTSTSMRSAHSDLLEELEECWEKLDALHATIETIIKDKSLLK